MSPILQWLMVIRLILPAAVPEARITLDQAVNDGLRISLEHRNRALDRESASLRLARAEKDRRFRLDFSAAYLYQSQTMTVETPAINLPGIGPVPGNRIEAGLHHNFDMNLRLSQPLYTGGVLTRSIEMEAVREAFSENEEALGSIEISGFIKSSYFQYRLLVRKRNSLSTLARTFELHRDRLNNLVDEGLARRTDLLETLSKLEETRMSLREIDQAIETERIHFRRLCGHEPEAVEPDFREYGIDFESALALFSTRHPVIRTLQKRLDLQNLQKKILSGRYRPQVSAFAEAHYGKPGLDFFKKEWSAYLQGGIKVDWAIFDWNRRKEEAARIEIESKKIETQRELVIRDVTEALRQSFTTLTSLEQQMDHAERLLAISREDARLKSALQRENQIPNLDYLAALQAQEKHRIRKDEILIRMEQVKVRINTMIGRTKEDQP